MGHIQDRWWTVEPDPVTNVPRRVKTSLHGTGLRYKVRYLDPEGRERARSFADRQKKAAEDFLLEVEGHMRRGTYVDPAACKMRFGDYAETWLKSQTFDVSTRGSVRWRLDAQILPFFKRYELGAITPTVVRTWIRRMQDKHLASSYQAVCFAHLSAILAAAVDDKLIRENPCRARTVTRPRPEAPKIVPWTRARVKAVQLALPERYKILVPLGAGLGLRQGEIFGVSPDDIDRDAMMVRVVRQVRQVNELPVFALPKRNKTREVPLSRRVLALIDEHAERYPPMPVTLPWRDTTGAATTVPLLITTEQGGALRRNRFNEVWNRARRAAGLANPTRQDGMHALRHHYASVLLDAGESIKALSEYLGHYDPGFTLRTYTHLMPNSAERTRRAIDALFGEPAAAPEAPADGESLEVPDGLETAWEGEARL